MSPTMNDMLMIGLTILYMYISFFACMAVNMVIGIVGNVANIKARAYPCEYRIELSYFGKKR